MSYAEALKELLYPLGVYRLENSINGAELESIGAALDVIEEKLEKVHQEADLTTAEEEGLETFAKLFAKRPVTEDANRLRRALAALMRVSGDSFTLSAINDNLAGC